MTKKNLKIVLSIAVILVVGAVVLFQGQSVQAANLETKTFAVKGMTCESCVYKINKSLKDVKGIESCDVDVQGGQVKIKADYSKAELSTIIEKIKALG